MAHQDGCRNLEIIGSDGIIKKALCNRRGSEPVTPSGYVFPEATPVADETTQNQEGDTIMFLKIITTALGLPFRLEYRGKAFLFPATETLPSVCIEPFEDVHAKGLIQRYGGAIAEATVAEVKAAQEGLGGSPQDPPVPGKPLAGTDVLTGTITVDNFCSYKPETAEQFLQDAEVNLPTLKNLLVYVEASENKATKKLAGVLKARIAFVEDGE